MQAYYTMLNPPRIVRNKHPPKIHRITYQIGCRFCLLSPAQSTLHHSLKYRKPCYIGSFLPRAANTFDAMALCSPCNPHSTPPFRLLPSGKTPLQIICNPVPLLLYSLYDCKPSTNSSQNALFSWQWSKSTPKYPPPSRNTKPTPSKPNFSQASIACSNDAQLSALLLWALPPVFGFFGTLLPHQHTHCGSRRISSGKL